MTTLIVLPMVAFIAAGAAFHFYWGFGGRTGWRVAVPQRADGTPLFVPSRAATLAVAFGLALILVALVAYALRLDVELSLPLSRSLQRIGMVALGLIFLGRGLAWHPYVGLFKTVRTTDFARSDTLFYSPGCIVTGLGFLLLAWQG